MATKRGSVRVDYEGMSVKNEESVRIVTRQEAQQLKKSREGYFFSNGQLFMLTHVPL